MSLYLEPQTLPVVEARTRLWGRLDAQQQEATQPNVALKPENFADVPTVTSEIAEINNTVANISGLQSDLGQLQTALSTDEAELAIRSKNSKTLTWVILVAVLFLLLYFAS